MKKVIFSLILATLVAVLISCGGSNTDTDTNKDEGTNKSSETDTDTSVSTSTDSSTDSDDSDSDVTSDSETGSTDTGSDEDSDSNTGTVKPNDSKYTVPTVEEILKTDLTVFNTNSYGDEGKIVGHTITNSINLAVDAFNKQFTIDKGGCYRLYGKSISGGVYVKAKDQEVILLLDGVDLTSKNNYPAIYAEDCKSLTIILKDGTKNILTDSSNNDGENAVIRVRSCNLKIEGRGALEINANAKYGIANTKELTINSGNIKITSPSHSIFGKLGVNINGGKLDLSAGKSGIKSGDEDDKEGAVRGYVNVNAASTTIKCTTNGINCYGPVKINDGKIVVNASEGNGIDASESIEINGGILVFTSYKSAVATDQNVSVTGSASLKLITNGNGISANDVTISTSGVIYIKTSVAYEEVTSETPEDETRYCLVKGEYVKYVPAEHGLNKILYVRRNCRGINAKNITVTNGIIGINSYEDGFNAVSKNDTSVNKIVVSGGKIYISTNGEGFEAESIAISDATELNILKSERGLSANYVEISGGNITIAADKDAISLSELTAINFDASKIDTVKISGGTIYLFEKIDLEIAENKVGKVILNGGTLLIVSTNNKTQALDGTAKYFSKIIENKDIAKPGKWIRITSGNDEVLVQLPKDFTEKMLIYYSSSTMEEKLTVEIGTISNENTFIADTVEETK